MYYNLFVSSPGQSQAKQLVWGSSGLQGRINLPVEEARMLYASLWCLPECHTAFRIPEYEWHHQSKGMWLGLVCTTKIPVARQTVVVDLAWRDHGLLHRWPRVKAGEDGWKTIDEWLSTRKSHRILTIGWWNKKKDHFGGLFLFNYRCNNKLVVICIHYNFIFAIWRIKIHCAQLWKDFIFQFIFLLIC